jgi:hypothetical protein
MVYVDDGLDGPCPVKMEFGGEGNYASAESKDRSGLTLPPKIQSSDPWLFDATNSISNEDFEALLGPLQVDLDGERLRREGSWIPTLLDTEHQPSEPPRKKPSLTGELSNDSVVEYGRHMGENESVCTLSSFSNCTELDQQPIPAQPIRLNSPRTKYPSDFGIGIPNASQNVEGSDCPQPGEELHQPTHDTKCLEGCEEELSFDVGCQGDEVIIQEATAGGEDLLEKPLRYGEPTYFDGQEAQTIRCSRSRVWDPDVPIPSVESEEKFIDGLNYEEWLCRGYKGPPKKLSKRATVELSKGMGLGLFTFDNSLAGDNSPENFSPARQNPYQKLDSFSNLPHQDSLPLSVAIALASPLQRPSIQKIVAHTQALLNSSTSPSSLPPKDTTSLDIPSELRQLFEKLEGKFSNDEQFRRSTVSWLTERMSSGGKSALLRHVNRRLLMDFSAVSADAAPFAVALDDLTHNLNQVTDLGSAVELIINERKVYGMVIANLNHKFSAVAAHNAKHYHQIKDLTARNTELEARLGQLGRENMYFKTIAQSRKYQVKEATRVITPTVSTTDVFETGDRTLSPENNRYWQCTLELTPGTECLGVNRDYYHKGRHFVVREKCARCSKKNLNALTRVYIDAKTAMVLGGFSSRLPSAHESTPPATPAQQNLRGAINVPSAARHYPPPTLKGALAALGLVRQPAKASSLAAHYSQTSVRQTFQGTAQAPSPAAHSESTTTIPQTVQEAVKVPSPPAAANVRRSPTPYRPSIPKLQVRTASIGSLTLPTLPAENSTTPSTPPTNKRRASNEVSPSAKRVRKSPDPPKKQDPPVIPHSTVDTLRAQLGKSYQRQWMKGPVETIDLSDDCATSKSTSDTLDELFGDAFEADFEEAFDSYDQIPHGKFDEVFGVVDMEAL